MSDELEFKANSSQAISEVKKLVMNLDELRAAQQKLKAQARTVAAEEKRQYTERARAARGYISEQNRLAAEQSRLAAQAQADTAKINKAVEARNAKAREQIRLSKERESADAQAQHTAQARENRLTALAHARAEASRTEARLAEADARRFVAQSDLRQTALREEVNLLREKNKIPLAQERRGLAREKAESRVLLEQERRKTMELRQQHRIHNQIIAAKERQKEQTQKLLISWESIGRILAVRIGYQALSAFTRQIREGITNALKFQQALASVQTIAQRSGLTTEQWADGLQRVSDGWRLDIIEQTEAAYQALTNQIVHGSEAFELLESANKFATVALVETNEAVRIAASVINAYGKSASQAEGIFASIFKTIELGRVRGGELTEIGRVLLPAAQLGVGYQEVFAGLEVITKQGVQVNEAMTFMRGIFQRMIRPTDKLREIFDEIGVSSGRAAFQTLGYYGVMERLQDIVGDDPELAGDVFQRIRSVTGFFSQQGSALQMLKRDYEEIINAQESYSKAAVIMRKTSAEQFQVMQSVISNIMTRTGSDIADMASRATNGFKTIVPVMREAIRLFKHGLAPAIAVATGALIKLGVTLLATPIGLKIAAIGALVTAYSWLRGSAERAAEAISSVVAEREATIGELLRKEAAYAQKVEEIAQRTREEQTRSVMQAVSNVVAMTNVGLRSQTKAAEEAQENLLSMADSTRKIFQDNIRDLENSIKTTEDTIKDALSGIRDLQTSREQTLFNWRLEGKEGAAALDSISRRIATLMRQADEATQRGDGEILNALQRDAVRLLEEQRKLEIKIHTDNEKASKDQQKLRSKDQKEHQDYLKKRLDLTQKLRTASKEEDRVSVTRELRDLDADRAKSLEESRSEYAAIQIHQIQARNYELEITRLIEDQIVQREKLAAIAAKTAADQREALLEQRSLEARLDYVTKGIRDFKAQDVVALGDPKLVEAQLKAQAQRIEALAELAGKAGFDVGSDQMRWDFEQQTLLIRAQMLREEVKERQRVLEIKQKELAVSQQEANNRRDVLRGAIDEVTKKGGALYKVLPQVMKEAEGPIREQRGLGTFDAKALFADMSRAKALREELDYLRRVMAGIQTSKSGIATEEGTLQATVESIGKISDLIGDSAKFGPFAKSLREFGKAIQELPGADGKSVNLAAAHTEYLGLATEIERSNNEMLETLKAIDAGYIKTGDSGTTQLERLRASTKSLNDVTKELLESLGQYKVRAQEVLDQTGTTMPTRTLPLESTRGPNTPVEKASNIGAINVNIQAGPSGKVNPSQIADAVRTAQRQGLLR